VLKPIATPLIVPTLNGRTMKQLTKVLGLAAFIALTLSACHSAKSCPAYGKASKSAAERRA
jgi:hypothetical protein